MVYNRGIPLSTDFLSTSQPQILGNFQTIDSGSTGTGPGFARNHITMTDGTNGGLHFRVDFNAPTTSPVLAGTITSLYPKTVSAISELFYKNGTADTQITGGGLVASAGSGFIPGGLQIRSGSGTCSTGGTVNAFNTAFPTACLSVVVTFQGSGFTANVQTCSASIIGAGSFTAYSSGAATTLYYIAIGY